MFVTSVPSVFAIIINSVTYLSELAPLDNSIIISPHRKVKKTSHTTTNGLERPLLVVVQLPLEWPGVTTGVNLSLRRCNMLAVIGKLRAAKGKEKELEQLLGSLPPIVHKNEKDTLLYIFHRNVADPAEFLFYEQYPDKKTFEAHLARPYIKDAFEKFSKLIEGEVGIGEYEVLIGDSGERP